jgi:hypothetical protein
MPDYLDQRVRHHEEPPRPVLQPDPELGHHRSVAGYEPWPGDLFFECTGKVPGCEEKKVQLFPVPG